MGVSIIKIRNDINYYQGFGGIVQLANGNIVLTYQRGDNTKGQSYYDSTAKIMAGISTDNGKTWGSDIALPVIPDGGNYIGNLSLFNINGTPTLFQTYFYRQTFDFATGNGGQLFYSTSTDGGVTWSTPTQIGNLDGIGDNIRAVAGRPIQTHDGSILVPTYGGGSYWATSYEFIAKSTDNMQTWKEITAVTVENPDSTHETIKPNIPTESTLLELKTNGVYSGKVMMMVRYDLISGNNFHKFISNDYGETWDTGTVMTFANYITIRPSLTRIGPNTILFTRSSKSWQWGNWMLSTDEGVTWYDIYRRYTAQTLNGTYQGVGIGYPESIVLQNGQIITTGFIDSIVQSDGSHTQSSVWVWIIDSADLTSQLPYNYLKLNRQKIVSQNL